MNARTTAMPPSPISRRPLYLIGGFVGAAVIGITLVVLPSKNVPAQTLPPINLPAVNTITVQGYQLVSEKRISRTVYDVTYRVTVRNSGPALIVVSGSASTLATNVTFPDSAASFGDISSGTLALSTDTFTIRQDRTRPFAVSQLVWQFRAAPGGGIPPDPGPANDLTIAGIDSDNDGVRDDVERVVAQRWPAYLTDGLLAARDLQHVITQQGAPLTPLEDEIAFCALALRRIDEGLLRSVVLNTEARDLAYSSNVGLKTIYRCQ